MRERMAGQVALATGLLVVLAAVAFAWLRNPSDRSAPAAVQVTAPVRLEGAAARGRAVFEREMCGACHSVAGEGNLRHPLDGAGARYSREELRKWIVPGPEMKSKLPARVFEAKQQFAEITPEDLDALVDYLSTLRAPPR